jgi:hypothetical protein
MMRKVFAELVVSMEGRGAADGVAGPSVQQAAAMIGNTEGTLRQHYAVNTRAGMAQAGVAAMGRLAAAAAAAAATAAAGQEADEPDDERAAKRHKSSSCIVM